MLCNKTENVGEGQVIYYNFAMYVKNIILILSIQTEKEQLVSEVLEFLEIRILFIFLRFFIYKYSQNIKINSSIFLTHQIFCN